MAQKAKDKEEKPVFHGCPGTRMKMINHKEEVQTEQSVHASSQLSQWPVQIKLVPVNAPYFKDANLLIAADCTAYAYGNFHQEFIIRSSRIRVLWRTARIHFISY